MELIKNVLDTLLSLYVFVIIIRALLSWFNPNPSGQLYRILYDLTEPVLLQIRRYLPNMGGIDLSPLILILIIQVLIRGILFRMMFSEPGANLGF